jgi:hypothetical protein
VMIRPGDCLGLGLVLGLDQYLSFPRGLAYLACSDVRLRNFSLQTLTSQSGGTGGVLILAF